MPGIYFLIPRSKFLSIGKIGLISGRVIYNPNQLVTVNRVGINAPHQEMEEF